MSWASGLGKAAAAMGSGMRQSDSVIESFVHRGVPCELRRGYIGANGYVYPPRRVRRALRDFKHYELPFEVHGGITWVSRGFTCLGFDTAHVGDWWSPEDLMRYSLGGDEAVNLSNILGNHPLPMMDKRVWSLARLRDETLGLAGQVAALDYVLPLRAPERAARRALRQARRKGDG